MLFLVRHSIFSQLATLPCLFLLAVGSGLHYHGISEQVADWCHAWGGHCCHQAHAASREQGPAAPEHHPDDCEVCRFYAQAKSVSVAVCVVVEEPLCSPQAIQPAALFVIDASFSPASPRGPPLVG